MSRPRHPRGAATDIAAHHRDWLSLVEISGPFLSLPVLRANWPAGLDPLDKPVRERLRRERYLGRRSRRQPAGLDRVPARRPARLGRCAALE